VCDATSTGLANCAAVTRPSFNKPVVNGGNGSSSSSSGSSSSSSSSSSRSNDWLVVVVMRLAVSLKRIFNNEVKQIRVEA